MTYPTHPECDRPYGIGTHLRSARLAAGLTQAQVARTLCRSAPLISAWENNERDPQTRDLINMNALYGCSVDSLLGLRPIDVEASQATLNRVRGAGPMMREAGWALTLTIIAREDGTTTVGHPGLPADAPLILNRGQAVKLRFSSALHVVGHIEGVGWEDEIEGTFGD